MRKEYSILVTGASGLLGKQVVAQFSKNHRVIGVSKSGRDQTQVCDLTKKTEVEALFKKFSFGLVIHTAAYSDVDGCEQNPGLAHQANALATKYLAECCSLEKIPFLYISTDYVFDGRRRSPYLEDHAAFPVNIYGLTKLEGEIWCQKLAPAFAIVRTSWLFGSGQDRNFVNVIIERMKNEKIVRVLDDQEDSPTYVKDLAVWLEKIADYLVDISRRKPGERFQKIFQICNAGSTTRYGMTLKIKRALGLKNVRVERLDRTEIPGRFALRPRYTVMSTRRFQSFFKIRPRKWEQSLEAYLAEREAL